MNRLRLILQHAKRRFKSVPLPIRMTVGIILLGFLYEGVFIIPTNVQLSYANKYSCADQITIAPTLQKQRTAQSEVSIRPDDIVRVFGIPVYSTQMCIAPLSAPIEGQTKVAISPWGSPLFSKSYKLVTAAAPVANVSGIDGKEISAVKRLTLPMSQTDTIHSYSLGMNDKRTGCAPTEIGLSCDISYLSLAPSTDYKLDLYRAYNDEKAVKINTMSVRTLTAVQQTASTLKDGSVIYDIPSNFTFTFDRALNTVDGSLRRTDGSGGVIEADFKVDDKTVVITPKAALARSATYQLALQQVTGKDGGSLVAPIVTNFTMSGGPKPTTVSVGSTNVPQSGRITVTFDQPIKADADITKFARVTGVNGTVVKVSDTSVAFTITNATLCADFSLNIDKGLPSGSNNEVSADAWKFDSRIVCGSSAIIGYSVKGRPITAYTFGSGTTTLLFTGGIHGSEQSGTTTMQALVTYLQGTKLPADKKVVVVPNTNPDGIAAGTRYNANNVNLDRNFPASNWRPDIDTATGTLATGGGTSAGSEPETRALITLTRQLKPRLEISYHAQGRLMGANQLGDSTTIGLAYAKTVGYASMIGTAEQEMGYSITGEYEDWMGQEMGIPAILLELPSNYGNYLPAHMTAINRLFSL